jgi:hypothetical protein
MKRTSMSIALLGLAVAAAPALAQEPPRPGTLNYVEGTAYLDGQKLNPNNVSSIDLEPGQELTTAAGKAEVLLTPGVYLRVGSNSAVKMISPDLAQTQVELDHGRAGIEADLIQQENNIQIEDASVDTRLLKKGYYEFNANQPQVRVFSGEAAVQVADGKTRDVKAHHELMLDGGPNGKPLAKEKPEGFNTNVAQTDQLYDWSKLRSEDLAENAAPDEAYAGYPGYYWEPGWGYGFFGPGLYSPFWGMGWGGPWGWGGWGGPWIGGIGYYGGGFYGGGHYYRGPHGRPGPQPGGFHGGGVHGGGFHAIGGGGFRGGMGGGFHGGGGGFHGGR